MRGMSRTFYLLAAIASLLVCVASVGIGYFLTVPAPAALSTPSAQSPAATRAPAPPTPALRPTATPTAVPLVLSSDPGIKVSAVAVPTPQPIAAMDFAALNDQLAQKIAALNQAELKFIRDMRATSRDGRPAGLALPALQAGSLTDQDIKDLAGKAMDVAILAEDLGNLAGKQDKGSDMAAKSAEPYLAIARNALSLVVESQTVRRGLLDAYLPGAQAIEIIASYGASLWNSAVTDGSAPANPFVAQTRNGAAEPVLFLNPSAAAPMQSQFNTGPNGAWLAESAAQNPRSLSVPVATSGVNPLDPQVRKSLTTAEGQTDGAKAQQVAAANLQRLGATANAGDPSSPSQLLVPSNPVAVAGSDQIKAGKLPTYKSGIVTVVTQDSASAANPFMQSLGLNGQETPTDRGRTAVGEAPALVSLSLTNIVIDSVGKPNGTGSDTVDVVHHFTVHWTTNLRAPMFYLGCGGPPASISSASGSLNKSLKLNVSVPGSLYVTCRAYTSDLAVVSDHLLGEASVTVFIGEAADATAFAADIATRDAWVALTQTAQAQKIEKYWQTATADALATRDARATQTAGAQQTSNAVGTEVAGTATAEAHLTATEFARRQALPPPATSTPTATPTFTPKLVDQLSHAGNVFAVTTNVVLQRGRLYRFSFSGRVNLINPTRKVSASDLPEHVNGTTLPRSGVIVIQGTGGKATISCGSGTPDPNDPGGFGISVEDLGPS